MSYRGGLVSNKSARPFSFTTAAALYSLPLPRDINQVAAASLRTESPARAKPLSTPAHEPRGCGAPRLGGHRAGLCGEESLRGEAVPAPPGRRRCPPRPSRPFPASGRSRGRGSAAGQRWGPAARGAGGRRCRDSAAGVMARAAGPALGLLLLAALPLLPLPAARSSRPDLLYISEYFSQSAQKLSFYSWYGNARLFRFHVPEDTILLRWLLQASKGKGPECKSIEITIHFRHGAPPVINPLGSRFPSNVTVRPSYNQTMTLSTTLQNSSFVNITTPAAGDWFIAVHLPEAAGKIEVKGFSTPCTYIFQPDMFVLRLVDVPVLEPDTPLQLTIASPARPLHVKIFIPEYTATMQFTLRSCVENSTKTCAVRVVLGSITLPQSFQKIIRCTGRANCSLVLDSPPWEKWLPIMAESLGPANTSVAVEMMASFTACKPGSTSSFLNFYNSLNQSQSTPALGGGPSASTVGTVGNTTVPAAGTANSASDPETFCLQNHLVIREDLDVASVRFRVINGPSVPVHSEFPTLLLFNLNTCMDSGGTLVVDLLLNETSLSIGNASVTACVSAASPVLTLNATPNCSTAFFQGYPLNMTASSPQATLIIPYPETDNWFLSLQLICPWGQGECNKGKAKVTVSTYLTPCFDDCGTYGQCSLLRRHGYLYAGCSCKAGWGGWSCTDNTKAQSVGSQNLATLLLTLSNLMFLPAIAVALYRFYLVEASVYTYTMFFSTFYHACDQPGVAVMCIMDYDTLQYCDFLGSVVAIWVTILCMARVKKIFKYVLFVLGTLLIAMSLQLDRRGIWNMMGPCLFALIIMIVAWVYHGVKRRNCYPPTWKRWVFYLTPGIVLALVALSVYAFMETNDNYYYTHSIWHILVASSVAFLLPPCDKHKKPWAWPQKLTCRYQICNNDREELYAVT